MRLDMANPFQAMMAFGTYQPAILRQLQTLARSGETVLVAGAHVGYIPLALASLGCRVICFEADPRNIESCNYNLSLNPQLNVSLIPAGLSDKDRTLPFWVADTDTQSSFAVSHRANRQVQVPVRQGDDAIMELGVESFDGILLDVEGWECHALEGLRQTLSRKLPRWAIIECAAWALEGAGKSPADLTILIESFGWRINIQIAGDLICG